MINPYFFTDEILKIGFKIDVGYNKINHANSVLSISPIYTDFGNEKDILIGF